MDSKPLRMRRLIGAVVPANMDRAKRFAKQVNRIYAGLSLAQCQEATAHVFGHADWHSLDKAVKEGGKSKAHDEEITPQQLFIRQRAQIQHMAFDLAGVDPDEKYAPPEMENTSEGLLNRAVGNDTRLAMGKMRFHRFLCETIIWEHQPTAEKGQEMWEIEDTSLHPASQEVMKDFPRLLGAWWKRCLPFQPEVGQALESFDWDKNKTTSIVHLAGYWGELCVHYGTIIDWTMVIGASRLLAYQYAAAVLQHLQVFDDAVSGETSLKKVEFDEKIIQLHFNFQLTFFDHYPRDDIIYAIGSDGKHAEEVIKILKSNTSKRGLWKS